MALPQVLRQGFIPVVTGGKGVDALLRPFLHLISDRVMVAYPHAILHPHIKELPLNLCIDSGSFGFIKYGGVLSHTAETTSLTIEGPRKVTITPKQLLTYQEQHGALGFTLDIPPREGEVTEQQAFDHSFKNALWALKQRRSGFPLLASLPVTPGIRGLRQACATLLHAGAEGIALGNLVRHRNKTPVILELVKEVRSLGTQFAIHVFGFGQPKMVRQLFSMGATTTDSSSYVQYALTGKVLPTGHETDTIPALQGIPEPAPLEMRNLALHNLAILTGQRLPLAFAPFPLHTPQMDPQR